jgi:hypothetical protein
MNIGFLVLLTFFTISTDCIVIKAKINEKGLGKAVLAAAGVGAASIALGAGTALRSLSGSTYRPSSTTYYPSRRPAFTSYSSSSSYSPWSTSSTFPYYSSNSNAHRGNIYGGVGFGLSSSFGSGYHNHHYNTYSNNWF